MLSRFRPFHTSVDVGPRWLLRNAIALIFTIVLLTFLKSAVNAFSLGTAVFARVEHPLYSFFNRVASCELFVRDGAKIRRD